MIWEHAVWIVQNLSRKGKMKKIKTEWSPTEVIQLLSKIENKLLDWDNQILDLSLEQRVEIRSIFDKYKDYYLYEEDW